MIPSILAETTEMYEFVTPYELFLLLNAIWGFLHCNPPSQGKAQYLTINFPGQSTPFSVCLISNPLSFTLFDNEGNGTVC